MSKIKLLVISPDNHGVGKFRIIDPYKFIDEHYSDDVHITLTFTAPKDDSYFKDYDIVVFHGAIHRTNHQDNVSRIKYLREKGIKTVMDIDDLWSVDQRHPMYHQIIKEKISEKKIELLRLVDYVTTTTPIFKSIIEKKLGLKNVFVFSNAVNPDEAQFLSAPFKSDKTRFGWVGGSSHLHDISLMSDAFQLIDPVKNNAQFVLCGFDTRGKVNDLDKATGRVRQRDILPHETVWFKYENIFTNKYKIIDQDYKNYLLKFTQLPYDDKDKPYIRKWTRDINTYAMNYNYFDIALVPLYPSEFNSCKSQLKIIEAGFHKKAVIASNVEPYTIDLINSINGAGFNEKGNALLVEPSKNHKQWAKHMKRLIDNPNMIEDLGNKLYETVKDKYSLHTVCKDRVDFIKFINNK